MCSRYTMCVIILYNVCGYWFYGNKILQCTAVYQRFRAMRLEWSDRRKNRVIRIFKTRRKHTVNKIWNGYFLFIFIHLQFIASYRVSTFPELTGWIELQSYELATFFARNTLQNIKLYLIWPKKISVWPKYLRRKTMYSDFTAQV